jgi:hypothetical protein
MKTIVKLIILVIVSTHGLLLHAQNWQRTLNSGSGGKNQLGTNDNFPVDFYTVGGLRMTLTTSGFLGLGTTNPAQMLHIHDGANGAYAHFTNTNIGNSAFTGFSVGIASDGTADLLERTDKKPMRFYTNSTLRMILNGTFTVMAVVASNLLTLSHLEILPQL